MGVKSITSMLMLALACFTNGLNILGIFPYDGKSHFVVFKVLLHHLANEGHNLTVISHFPEHKPLPNYNDINLRKSGKLYTPEDYYYFFKFGKVKDNSNRNIFESAIYLAMKGRNSCKIMLANREVRDLINDTVKYDVVLTEDFNSDCALGIAYKLGAPVVRLTANVLMPWHYARMGIPYNPAYVPCRFQGGGHNPTLWQKVQSIFFDSYFKFWYYTICQRSDQKTLAEYYDDIPPLEDLARNIKFLLVNHHFTLTGSRLFPANVIEVGGYHVTQNPITGDLKQFMDNADHGIIYISFGTRERPSNMTLKKMEAIIGAIDEMPLQFIWRWDKYISFDEPPLSLINKTYLDILKDDKKFFSGCWLPQVDILGHEKMLGFISHAGMGGTTEAIHHGVPIIAIPLAGDQPANAASIEESGLGIQLPRNNLTKNNLVEGMKKILEPEFRAKVKRISKAWHDRPLTPMQTAVYWIEYAARNPDLNFKTKSAEIHYYQYYNLDIAVVFSVSLVIMFILTKVILWLLFTSDFLKIQLHKKKEQ